MLDELLTGMLPQPTISDLETTTQRSPSLLRKRVRRETMQLLTETHPILEGPGRRIEIPASGVWRVTAVEFDPRVPASVPTAPRGTQTTDAKMAESHPAPSPSTADRTGAPTDGTAPTAGDGGGPKIPATLSELRESIGLPIGGPDVQTEKDRQRELLYQWTKIPLMPHRALTLSQLRWMWKPGVLHLMQSAPHLTTMGWREMSQPEFMALTRRNLITLEQHQTDPTKQRLILASPLYDPAESMS